MSNRKSLEELEELSPQELGWLLLCEVDVFKPNTQYLKNIINSGADLEVITMTGLSRLHLAAKNGHIELVKDFLAAGASLEAKDHHDNTPLHFAACSGYNDIVELLLDAGASKEAKNSYGWTPYHSAILSLLSPIEKLKP